MENNIYIVEFCIGSPEFKKQNLNQFINSLNEVNPFELYIFLSKRHLVNNFYGCLIDIDYKNIIKFKELFYPEFHLNKIIINCYLKELKIIGQKSKQDRLNPTLLKGSSFWVNKYKNIHIRQSDDIDILIQNIAEIDKFCTNLEEMNFKNVDINYKEYYFSKEHYELSTFHKKIKYEVNKEDITLINKFFELNSRLPSQIIQLNKDTIIIDLAVEIHKSPFMFVNGNYVDVQNELSPSSIDGFYMLSDSFNLPYLSLKFFQDTIEYKNGDLVKAKAIKLIGDIVKILSTNIDQTVIEKSIDNSIKWNIEYMYAIFLNRISHLIPEILMENLEIESNLDIYEVLS